LLYDKKCVNKIIKGENVDENEKIESIIRIDESVDGSIPMIRNLSRRIGAMGSILTRVERIGLLKI